MPVGKDGSELAAEKNDTPEDDLDSKEDEFQASEIAL